MKRKLFETLSSQPKPTHKSLFFLVSIFFHGLLTAAIIAVPLMTADTGYPGVRIVDAVIVAPPQPPPVPRGKPGGGKQSNRPDTNKPKPKPSKPNTFSAPEIIPDDIQEEAIEMPGIGGGGSDNGNIIGAPEWGVNAPIFELKEDDSSGGTIKVSLIERPRLIRRIAPQYPLTAKKARIEGKVLISAVTDIYGKVTDLQVIEGHPLLRGAAARAVRQWIYEPYIIRGIPKPVQFTVTVHFKLTH
jgi:TonB family protein